MRKRTATRGRPSWTPVTAFAALAAVPALAWGAPARAADSPDSRSCAWLARLSGDQINAVFPDEAAEYWIARVQIPPGGHVEIAGRYPHARYISFISYTNTSQAIDGLADVEIAPDPESTNPFPPGARRTVERRSYQVLVRNGPPPAPGRDPNTIYTDNGQSGAANKSSSSGQGTLLMYRVYEPDRGRDITGGVGLPELTLVSADGGQTAMPDCRDTSLPDLGATQALAAAGPGALPKLPQTGLDGRNPPQWTRYTNAVNAVGTAAVNNERTGDALTPSVQDQTNTLPSGGGFENIHIAYVFTFYRAAFGDVLVLRGKAPTTPRTFDGQRTMGRGQLRYYSLCTGTATTSNLGCLVDDAIPVDARGQYTIAVSTAANRPSNATRACGMGWLPAGPNPPSPTALLYRHMLPVPRFHHAIQNAEQGSERQTMGAYYPAGTYYERASDVERLGCRRR